MRTAFYVTTILLVGLGSSAGAAPGVPMTAHSLGLAAAVNPVAMCGYSCRRGGRYIPGPPSVCYDEGLNYCGSSRDAGPRRFYDGGGYDDRGYGRRYERYERY